MRALRTGMMMILGCAAICFQAFPAAAATHVWTGSWDTPPATGGDIVIRSGTNLAWTAAMPSNVNSWVQEVTYTGTVRIDTVYSASGFTNLVIANDCVISNGFWMHQDNSAAETYRLKVSVGGNLTVAANAKILVDGLGYDNGKPTGYGLSQSGGSHGGRGNCGATEAGPTYGSIVKPVNLGSGGAQTPGGGAVYLDVVGTATIDGTIGVNGSNAVNYSGAGGSVYLAANALSGAGTIRANGGDAGTQAGGGGRIALILKGEGQTFGAFTGPIQAYGGYNVTKPGAAGTIYKETKADVAGKGELWVNNSNRVCLAAAFPLSWRVTTELLGASAMTSEFARLVITNAGVISLGADDTLILTNTVITGGGTNRQEGIRLFGGKLVTPDAFGISNLFISVHTNAGAQFMPAESLTLGTQATLIVNTPWSLTNRVTVEAGGLITHDPNNDKELFKANLTVNGSLEIKAGGAIDVSRKGYVSPNGPGYTALNQPSAHGGQGGKGGVAYGGCYGSVTSPTNLGSGGSIALNYGGGAVRLVVTGPLTNNGTIRADGANDTYYTGSGGSIWITAPSLHGAGVITANAGDVSNDHAGGGGRIAIVLTNGNSFAGQSILARGGIKTSGSGSNPGGNGTVYLKGMDQAYGVLILDNSNFVSAGRAVLSSNVTDTTVGDVVIRNGGRLRVETNQALTVYGTWSNAFGFTAGPAGTVVFAGAADATVWGTNTFDGFTCATPGKILRFEAGKTNRLTGALSIAGASGNPVTLRSLSPGAQWFFYAMPGSSKSVSYAHITDSNAGGGDPIPTANSTDGLNNLNWVFGGATVTWTGSSNSVWGVSSNWDLGRLPTDQDIVIIPDTANDPVLDAYREIGGLTNQAGASLTLNGYSLLVNGAVRNAGAITASAGETITCKSDVDFTAGSFTPARSTLLLAGTGAQRLTPDSKSFHRIQVSNGSTVTVQNAFAAAQLYCLTGGASIVFNAGSTFAVGDLKMIGSAGAPVYLRSSSSGSAWNLNVSGLHVVRDVDVKDSNASGGRRLYAINSTDSTGNSNWDFGTWHTWSGAASGSFTNDANWTNGVAPGAGSFVLIDGNGPNAPVISSNTTIGRLVVGLTQASILTINTNVLALGDVTVNANGVLTHSANSTTEQFKVIMDVGGDFLIEMGGTIDVTSRGYDVGYGPGTPGTLDNNHSGAAHGGRGSEAPGIMTATYGSLLHPVSLGSGGATPGYPPTSTGGGAISLTVAGRVVNNGAITASAVDGLYGRGSGGSVFVDAGSFSGGGTIRANGGAASATRAGGGGRIAVVVTNVGADFSAATLTNITACGGVGATGNGGAGTVYLQTAAQGAGKGVVIIDNGNQPAAPTEIPARTNGVPDEPSKALFIVTNRAAVLSTANATIADLAIYTNSAWALTNWTLSVKAREHALDDFTKSGAGATNRVDHYEQLIWLGMRGTVILVR